MVGDIDGAGVNTWWSKGLGRGWLVFSKMDPGAPLRANFGTRGLESQELTTPKNNKKQSRAPAPKARGLQGPPGASRASRVLQGPPQSSRKIPGQALQELQGPLLLFQLLRTFSV